MEKEKGMGLISIIFVIILIIALVLVAYYFLKNSKEKEQLEDIKANMLLIQGKAKIINESSKANNNTDNFKGTKVSDIKEDQIISTFLNKGLLPEDKLDKYYVLSNDDLSSMELEIKNEENSYYIVNYEENTVFITKGYENKDTNEVIYTLE